LNNIGIVETLGIHRWTKLHFTLSDGHESLNTIKDTYGIQLHQALASPTVALNKIVLIQKLEIP
jgi:hypothetical protein